MKYFAIFVPFEKRPTRRLLWCVPRSANLARISYVVVPLIAKVDDAKLVKDFRPISLLNCIFNIFTKILANMLLLFFTCE